MISDCLQKDPSKRPTASELLKHPFFKKAKDKKYLTTSLLTGPEMRAVQKVVNTKRQPGASGKLHRTNSGEWDWSSDEDEDGDNKNMMRRHSSAHETAEYAAALADNIQKRESIAGMARRPSEPMMSPPMIPPAVQSQAMSNSDVSSDQPVNLVLRMSHTGERKKVQKSIEFPHILDMTEFLSPEHSGGDERLLYQLNAVLIHKGRRVSSGHYLAHIKDSVSGVWFECNDDSIEKIDRKGYSKNLVMHEEDEDPKEGNSKPTSSTDRAPTLDNRSREPSTSTDPKDKKLDTMNPSLTGAYMLVYTKVKYFQDHQPDPDVPADLIQLITQEDYLIGTSVNLVDFIAVDWLEKWLDPKGTDPPEITNETVLCPHGKLAPSKSRDVSVLYRIIPSNFADRVYEKYKGVRLSGEPALCLDCVRTHCKMIRDLLQLEEDSQVVAGLIKKTDDIFENYRKAGVPPPEDYWSDKVIIGKDTSRNWKRFAKNDIERLNSEDCQEISIWNFNQDVECEHGRLNPNSAGNRKFISLDAWSIITKYFESAPMYSKSHEQCQECCNFFRNSLNSIVKDQNKKLAQRQKQLLAPLFNGKNRPSEHLPGEYYIVSTQFIQDWRKFIKNLTGLIVLPKWVRPNHTVEW